MHKKLIPYLVVPAVLLTVAGVGLAAQAATSDGSVRFGANPMASLVAAIAQKFNLSTADVQQVFNDQRTQMVAQHEQMATARINQAVTDGKLTQAQATLIIAKHAELKTFRASLEGKTEAEQMAAMKAQMESLKQWATDNGIPREYLGGHAFGKGKGHGHGGPRGFGPRGAPTPAN